MNRTSLLFLTACLAIGWARGVKVDFDPSRPDIGPFPTNHLTVRDEQQRTGLRVALPLPDCDAAPSDCREIQQLNELDGFSPTPRLTVHFSAAINPDTLRDNVYVAWLDSTLPIGRYQIYPAGRLSPVNEVIWDPATRTAYMKPDEMLEQSRSFLILVTDGVRDTAGDPVEPSAAFQNCASDYCSALRRGLSRIPSVLPGGQRIAGASLFTTLSVTAFLEEARTVVRNTAPRFRVTNPVVDLSRLRGLAERQHVRPDGDNQFRDFVLPIPGEALVQLGIGKIAFGSFRSPVFVDPSTLRIPQTATAEPVTPIGENEVHFHVWLPRTPAPPGGYPVLIAAHGLGDTRFGAPTWFGTATGAGFAVFAMGAAGHGFGPDTTYRFTMADGSVVSAPAPGRSLDADKDGVIGPGEGCVTPSPDVMIIAGDCSRQTAVDLLQAVHAMADGIDLDGDGRRDLNPDAIYYLGQSLGGTYGSMFMTLEQRVRAAVFNVPPGSLVETGRTTRRADLKALFEASISVLRRPSLFNNGGTYIDDIPFRNEPVRVRTRAGAAALQDYIDRAQWVASLREAPAYGPYLHVATLPEVFVRPILFQMGAGDLQAPNHTTSALIRAAFQKDRTSYYRHDLARQVAPGLSPDAHTYILPLGPPESFAIATAALSEAVQFLLGERYVVPDVNPMVRPAFGRSLFEVPSELPEQPNYPRAP